jgi:hypothetical protein
MSRRSRRSRERHALPRARPACELETSLAGDRPDELKKAPAGCEGIHIHNNCFLYKLMLRKKAANKLAPSVNSGVVKDRPQIFSLSSFFPRASHAFLPLWPLVTSFDAVSLRPPSSSPGVSAAARTFWIVRGCRESPALQSGPAKYPLPVPSLR